MNQHSRQGEMDYVIPLGGNKYTEDTDFTVSQKASNSVVVFQPILH